MRRVLVLVLLLGAGGLALADEPKPEGEYGGVQPAVGKAEAAKKPKRPAPKGTLSWIGFEVKDGGSEVFFQSAAAFEVSQRIDKGVLVVTLGGLSRLGHNIWRPIDTRFFETPLSRIVARKKGRGVEVRIAFKNAKGASQAGVRTGNEADGMYYAHLTFGGGAAQSEPEAPEKTDKPAEKTDKPAEKSDKKK